MAEKSPRPYSLKTVKLKAPDKYLRFGEKALANGKYGSAIGFFSKADISYQVFGDKGGSRNANFLVIATKTIENSKISIKIGDYKAAKEYLQLACKKFNEAGYKYGEFLATKEISRVESLAAKQSQRIKAGIREKLEKVGE